MDDITTRCIAIIAKSKNMSPEAITPDSTFDQLGMDSLDKINVSFEVEDTFEIAIPDESMNSLRTVQDMVDGVLRLQQQKVHSETLAEESK